MFEVYQSLARRIHSPLTIDHSLFQSQEAFYKIEVRFCNCAVFSQIAFPFFRLLCEDVPFERLLVRDLTGARYFEALFGTGICFNLWHFIMLFMLYP
jgi:hypothetical protein